jgi:hypothetical protein
MSAEHFVILIGLIVATTLITQFVRRTIRCNDAEAREQASSIYVAQMEEMDKEITELVHLRQLDKVRFDAERQRTAQEMDELRKFKRESSTATLTKQDMRTLKDIVATLDMAHQTWLPMRGTDPWRAKAAAQVKSINILANRVLDSLQSENAPVLIEQCSNGKAA